MHDAKFKKMFWGIVAFSAAGIILGFMFYAWVGYTAYTAYKESNSSEIAKATGAFYKEFRRAAERED